MPEPERGAALSRRYFLEVVEPLLAAAFPGLPYAAGRLGTGSDVLGLDDAVSRDHDWGLRLSLVVPEGTAGPIREELDRRLPDAFLGLPTRFAATGTTAIRHHVEVDPLPVLLQERLGFDPRPAPTVRQWLSLSGQAVLEVTAGPVFTDRDGGLASARRALAWYPDDLWRHLLACDWIRIEQELPSMGRAAEVGDDLGARILAGRIAQILMHLAFLLDRRWPPYAKWFGSLFRALPLAEALAPSLRDLLAAPDGAGRDRAVAAALDVLQRRQRELGLATAASSSTAFWDRRHLRPAPLVAEQLLAPITDPEVRALPRGRGSVEQRTANVDVLVDPAARRSAVER